MVICDRFTDSSIAYQGYGRQLGEQVAEVNSRATGGLEPDITFWLDIDPYIGRERAGRAGELDRLETEKMDFHKRVRDGYRELTEKDPARIRRIDASKTIEEMRDDIYACLEELCRSRDL